MSVRIAMIAAVARNGVIGANGTIPWRIPSDLAFFKRTTMGKPIVMGRKQYESVGRPLPGRINIVVTRQRGYQPDGVIVINELGFALAHARSMAEVDGVDEVMVIGGGDIYRQAMPLADRLYISHVDLAPEGDIRFPEIAADTWAVVERPRVPLTGRDESRFETAIYGRVRSGSH